MDAKQLPLGLQIEPIPSDNQAVSIRSDVRFTLEDARRAGDQWRFNCGPASLCAVLGMTPEEIRPHMLDFEMKGYTNPTLVFDVLNKLRVKHCQVYRSDNPLGVVNLNYGLMRVQWGGPWTGPNVPMRARYWHTHWVGVRRSADKREVFDVNAMCVGGWLPWQEWSLQLVPWLLKQVCPKGDGRWWPTHGIEVGI